MKHLSLKSAAVIFPILLILGATHGLAQEKVLKVGVMAPFTGPSAQTGNEFKSVSTMAFDNIGNQIGDYKIELIWIDSQSDPAKAAAAYAEAVERKGMEVGILNWHSSVAISVMDVAAQYKVPHLFAFGAAPIIDEKYKSDPEKYQYWCGKGWPVPAKLTLGYTECIQNAIDKGLWKPEKKMAAIYGEDTDWGRSQGEALTQEFKKIGWEVLSQDYFPPTQTDFYPLLSKWRKEGVSVIAGTSTSAPAITALVKQADEVSLGAVIIADGLGWVGDWYKLTGAASNNVLDMIPALTTPEAKKWAEDVEKRFGYKPSPSASGLAYDWSNFAIKVFKRTFEKHKELNRTTILEVFQNEVIPGKLTYSKADGALIMNEYRFSPETIPDAVVARDGFYFPVLQYENGQGHIVYPDDWKDQDFKAAK